MGAARKCFWGGNTTNLKRKIFRKCDIMKLNEKKVFNTKLGVLTDTQ